MSEKDILSNLYMEMMYEYVDEFSGEIELVLSGGFRSKGETKIRNKSKLISEKEIGAILKLLHKDYSNLGMTISVYSRKYQVLLDCLDPFHAYINKYVAKQSVSRKIAGNHRHGLISIFPMNFRVKGIDCRKTIREVKRLLTVSILIHEVRHAYQRTYKTKKYNFDLENETEYHTLWVEKDANSFSQRFMENNKCEINRILGIPEDLKWKCVWGHILCDKKK